MAGVVASMVECMLSMHKDCLKLPPTHKSAMVIDTSNLSTQEIQIGGSEGQGYSVQHSESEANMLMG